MTGNLETAIYAAILGMTEAELVEAELLPARHLLPRAPRHATLIGALLLRDELPMQDIIVRNVSQRGMCIASRGAAPLHDEIVCIRLPENVEHMARVRWVEDRAFGVELFQTLDVEALGAANRRRNADFLQVLELQPAPAEALFAFW